MSALANRQWTVTTVPLGTAGEPVTRQVTAAYITGDAALPGWTLLKDADHKVVYQIRSDMAMDIQRAGEPADASPAKGTRA